MLLKDEPRLTHAREHDWTLTDPCPTRLRHVRDAVNTERAKHNLPPLLVLPKGNVRCAESCVLARALEARAVGGTGWYIKNGKTWHPGELLVQFVRRFDTGEYPELVED